MQESAEVADIAVAAVPAAADIDRKTVEAAVVARYRGGLVSLVVGSIAAAEEDRIEAGRHQRWRGVERYLVAAAVEACLVAEHKRVASAEVFVAGLC